MPGSGRTPHHTSVTPQGERGRRPTPALTNPHRPWLSSHTGGGGGLSPHGAGGPQRGADLLPPERRQVPMPGLGEAGGPVGGARGASENGPRIAPEQRLVLRQRCVVGPIPDKSFGHRYCNLVSVHGATRRRSARHFPDPDRSRCGPASPRQPQPICASILLETWLIRGDSNCCVLYHLVVWFLCRRVASGRNFACKFACS